MAFIQSIQNFAQDEEGVTAIEYGLIAALVAVFLIAALNVLGGSLDGIFRFIAGELDAAKTPAAT